MIENANKYNESTGKFMLPKVLSEGELRKISNKNLLYTNDNFNSNSALMNANNLNNIHTKHFMTNQTKGEIKENENENKNLYNNNSSNLKQDLGEKKPSYTLANKFAKNVSSSFSIKFLSK